MSSPSLTVTNSSQPVVIISNILSRTGNPKLLLPLKLPTVKLKQMANAPNAPLNIILLVADVLLFPSNAAISITTLTNVKDAIVDIILISVECAKKLTISVKPAIVKETASPASITTALQSEEDASILQLVHVMLFPNKRITLSALNSIA